MWNAAEKRSWLKDLYQAWESCSRCGLCETRHNVVFGNGPPNADIMFVGEGPGEIEDKTGEAFAGPSGHLLNALLEVAKIARDDVFVTNIVMCRPPGNRAPTRTEEKACWERLSQQIYIVDPLIIVAVGGEAMEFITGVKGITKRHGDLLEAKIPGRYDTTITYPVVPIYHPAYIMREDTINRKTMQWERGGLADQTARQLDRVRRLVEWLKAHYESASALEDKKSRFVNRRGRKR